MPAGPEGTAFPLETPVPLEMLGWLAADPRGAEMAAGVEVAVTLGRTGAAPLAGVLTRGEELAVATAWVADEVFEPLEAGRVTEATDLLGAVCRAGRAWRGDAGRG